MCTMCIQCPWRPVKGHWDPLELKLQVVLSHLILTVETKPGSSGKAASAFNYWAEPSVHNTFAILFYTKIGDQNFFSNFYFWLYKRSRVLNIEVMRPLGERSAVGCQLSLILWENSRGFWSTGSCFSYIRSLVAQALNSACRQRWLNFWLPLRPEPVTVVCSLSSATLPRVSARDQPGLHAF